MLAKAACPFGIGIKDIDCIALVGAFHLISVRMAGIARENELKEGLISNGIPLRGNAATDTGLAGKFSVAEHLGRKTLENIGAGML